MINPGVVHTPSVSYKVSVAELIAELGKKKVKLSLSEEAEWEDYFLQESKKATDIKTRIETTDKEIDQMVYALYGLTEEEIKIVKGQRYSCFIPYTKRCT